MGGFMQYRRLEKIAVAVLAVGTLLTHAPALAQQAEAAPVAPSAPADLVLLKNGGLVRGTISELVPAEKVVIVTITGEARSYPMAEVEYAGPASGAPSAKPISPALDADAAPSSSQTASDEQSGSGSEAKPSGDSDEAPDLTLRLLVVVLNVLPQISPEIPQVSGSSEGVARAPFGAGLAGARGSHEQVQIPIESAQGRQSSGPEDSGPGSALYARAEGARAESGGVRHEEGRCRRGRR
ncbi:MAG: hypothetical protein OEZ06_32785, partial [Myxococcales bacterium]|nr:hypothetical protein [Myxococcales bacterium]